MIPTGMLFDELCDLLSAHSNPPMLARIWTRINYELVEICRAIPLAGLRADKLPLDFTTVTTSGLWLPSDLLGIELVWDDKNSIEFFERDRHASVINEWGYRYYRFYPSRTDLYSGTDLELDEGGSAFTSANLTAAGATVLNEYVRFDDEPGIYKITNQTTHAFEPTYYGPAKSSKPFAVRPWQMTQKLVILDGSETMLTDRTVDVYYWRLPVPVYRTQDMLPMPTAEYLKLRVLRGIPQSKAAFPVSESMLTAAKRDLIDANPKFARTIAPRDKQFAMFDSGTNPFDER